MNIIQKLFKQLDRYAIIGAVVLIIILSLAYFWLASSFNPTEGSGLGITKQFAMSLITNLIPVFLLFAVSYFLFRKEQEIRSEHDTDSLVKKISEAVSNELKGINSKLEELRGLLEQNLGGQTLEREEIYPAVTRLIGLAKKRVRIILLESRPAPPDNVLEAIAERLFKKEVYYDLVIVLQPDSNDLGRYENTHKNLVQRLELQSQEAKARYNLHVLETKKTICFDTLIVDDQHIGVGFTRFQVERDVQNAIMFKNHPELTEKFAEWFDQMILPQSQKYEEWAASKQSVDNKLNI